MHNKDLKIIFFGDTEFSEPSRQALVKNEYNITVISKKDGSLKDEKFFEYFKGLNPDICIVADYGRIIPAHYLEIPKFGFINIHPSLLPKYRGPSPIQTTIINGDMETGVTIIKVDAEVDHGDILSSIKYQVSRGKKYKDTESDLAGLGAKLLTETLPKYLSGEIKPQEQGHSRATYTKMLVRQDGRIDWGQPAEKIYDLIRAISHEPGTWTLLRQAQGQAKILNIKEADVLEKGVQEQPGIVVNVDNEIVVATGKWYLILKTVQLEGKRETDVKAFINGYRDFLNSKLE